MIQSQESSDKRTTWECIKHWMWPLLLRTHILLRSRLGLPIIPQEIRNFCPSRLLYAISSSFVIKPDYWPSNVEVIGHIEAMNSIYTSRISERPVDTNAEQNQSESSASIARMKRLNNWTSWDTANIPDYIMEFIDFNKRRNWRIVCIALFSMLQAGKLTENGDIFSPLTFIFFIFVMAIFLLFLP